MWPGTLRSLAAEDYGSSTDRLLVMSPAPDFSQTSKQAGKHAQLGNTNPASLQWTLTSEIIATKD